MKREKKDNPPQTGSGGGASGGGRKKPTATLKREIEASIRKVRELKSVRGLYPVRMRHCLFRGLEELASPDFVRCFRSLLDGDSIGRSLKEFRRGDRRAIAEVVRVIRDVETLEFTRQCEVRDRALDVLIDAARNPEAYADENSGGAVAFLFNGDDEYVLQKLPDTLRNRILLGVNPRDGQSDKDILTIAEVELQSALEVGVAIGKFLAVLTDRLMWLVALRSKGHAEGRAAVNAEGGAHD